MSAIHETHQAVISASAGRLVAANEATSYAGVEDSTGNAVKPLPPGCRVPRVQGGGERDPACVISFVNNAISMEV